MTVDDADPWYADHVAIDLGDGNHRAGWIDWNDGKGRRLYWFHHCEGGRHQLGRLDVESGERHGLVSEEPLTIEGSLFCVACNDHGFIRDGRWVPA